MDKLLPFFLALVLLGHWSCSTDPMTPIPLPPTFEPSQNCRIDRWSTPNADNFSYDFTYEEDRLAGMLMTAPSFQWPIRYRFGYSGDQLTRITQTLENGFPDYDSLVTLYTYDGSNRPVTSTSSTFLDGESIREATNVIEYNDFRFIVREEGPNPGPFQIFLLDITGNVERLEEYDVNGGLIRLQDASFDDRPSPFRDFPAVFKLHFYQQIGPSWHNNVSRSRCEDVPAREETFKQLSYSYNDAGYPIESRTPGETLVYRMVYGKCE